MAHQDPHTFKEIFTPLGAALAIFGGLGGLVRALVVKSNWRDTARVTTIGAATAFGIGTMTPAMLKIVNIPLPENPALATGFISSTAFIVGVVAVAVVEWMIERSEKHDE
jgi:hypothetical protein